LSAVKRKSVREPAGRRKKKRDMRKSPPALAKVKHGSIDGARPEKCRIANPTRKKHLSEKKTPCPDASREKLKRGLFKRGRKAF